MRALGGLVVALGKGWGFQLQSAGFNYALAAFFLIFGLNMAGVFEIGASAVGVGQNLQAKHGLGGSFFSGLLATMVSTPCSAPFLGTALGFAVKLPAPLAMLLFTLRTSFPRRSRLTMLLLVLLVTFNDIVQLV